MSWMCMYCYYENDDKSGICVNCQNSRVSVQQTETIEKWVIECPECRKTIVVDSADSFIDICPHCSSTEIEKKDPFLKSISEAISSQQLDEKELPRCCLVLREISAQPVYAQGVSRNQCPLYKQTGTIPRFTGCNVFISENEQKVGRDSFPSELKSLFFRISQEHCIITYDDNEDSWFVVDTNSTNGTRLNDKRLISGFRARLSDGCTLQLANKLFIVEIQYDGENSNAD